MEGLLQLLMGSGAGGTQGGASGSGAPLTGGGMTALIQAIQAARQGQQPANMSATPAPQLPMGPLGMLGGMFGTQGGAMPNISNLFRGGGGATAAPGPGSVGGVPLAGLDPPFSGVSLAGLNPP